MAEQGHGAVHVASLPRTVHTRDAEISAYADAGGSVVVTSVKTHFSAVVDTVHNTHERVVVTRNGEPAVVVMAVEDLESSRSDLAIIQDVRAMADPAEAEAAVNAGDTVDADELRAMIETRAKRR